MHPLSAHYTSNKLCYWYWKNLTGKLVQVKLKVSMPSFWNFVVVKGKLNSFQNAERIKLLGARKVHKQSIFQLLLYEIDAVCTRIKHKMTINLKFGCHDMWVRLLADLKVWKEEQTFHKQVTLFCLTKQETTTPSLSVRSRNVHEDTFCREMCCVIFTLFVFLTLTKSFF